MTIEPTSSETVPPTSPFWMSTRIIFPLSRDFLKSNPLFSAPITFRMVGFITKSFRRLCSGSISYELMSSLTRTSCSRTTESWVWSMSLVNGCSCVTQRNTSTRVFDESCLMLRSRWARSRVSRTRPNWSPQFSLWRLNRSMRSETMISFWFSLCAWFISSVICGSRTLIGVTGSLAGLM